MSRQRWLILLLLALALALCCGVVLCTALTAAGYLLREVGTGSVPHPSIEQEPAPTPAIIPIPPTAPEREAARALGQTSLPVRDPVELAYRFGRIPQPLALIPPDKAPRHRPGDSKSFWILDEPSNTYFSSTATLRYETPHAYWWLEQGAEVAAEDLERSAERFEAKTYPTSRRFFGSEPNPGVDGDPFLYIYLGDVPGVGGYYSAPDEYPPQISAYSNQHEMIYVNLLNAMPGTDYFDGILAHEFQHMIHWAVDRNEAGWVNEGLSELAAHLNGYDVGGSDFLFSQTPDTQLTAWPDLADSGPNYGGSYLFLAYFLDRYGEAALGKLVAEQADGAAGFEAVLVELEQPETDFDQLFGDWVIATLMDDPDMADGRYGYSDLAVEPPALAAQHADYPVYKEAVVHQYAADYIELTGRGDVTVEFTGSLAVPLVGNQARSGQYQWWSVPGDDGDATLTQAFDFSGLARATLEAWTWYDLEGDYDYGYVVVSTDGGQTWDILANENTATANPTGSSYGPSFNGVSGGGEEPAWVKQTFDLSRYAGRQVLVRFEVITDEAVTKRGLCVDDIAIPELGYFSDVEDGQDGWHAAGWVRVTSQVPQDFVVQLITLGAEARVERMVLDEAMHGWLSIEGLGGSVGHAFLVVAAITPVTTEWASYAYRVTLR